ncbi:MAG: molecular chaperone TorD family protein [Coriobacteriales bacterium]|jgi:TorA maturation chaperone TorD|nr:molecular chaperone TorD family protein [Coriobacteriales bacterium]
MGKDTELYLNVRVFLYELGHSVFGGEPNGELLSFLVSDENRQLLKVTSEDFGGPAAHLAQTCAELKAQSESDTCGAVLANLKSDYTHLILGLGGKKESYPWESYYMNYRRMLFQESTLAVRESYRRFGYRAHAYGRIPEDHFSLECAFIAELGKRTIDALSRNEKSEYRGLLKGQLVFLKEHLLKWGPRYVADLRIDRPESLYAAVAELIVDVATRDYSLLGARIEEEDYAL